MIALIEKASEKVFYPLWDYKDKSLKLRELAELEKSQWLSIDQIKNIQWGKLVDIVQYASIYSPYYRLLFEKIGFSPADISDESFIQKIPVTTKSDIRNNLSSFISNEFVLEDLVMAKTGGSTGYSLKVYFDEYCEQRRNAAAIRSDMWAGWKMGQKKAALWGNPDLPKTLKQKIRNLLLDRIIYLDTIDLSDHSMEKFARNWHRENPKAIFGHAHSIYILAKYLVDHDITDLRPNAIISTSMMLLKNEREIIESCFDCKVSDRYGCEEVGLIASECERHEGMHLNVEHVFVEFLDEDDKPVKENEEGRLIITDLCNHGMPLIRYEVGDVAAPLNSLCNCGRSLPLMSKLTGRVADFLQAPSGSKVSGISLVERTLTKVPGIEQMQLVQKSLDLIEVNRVKAREYTELSDQQLVSELREVFGAEINIKVHDVLKIPQTNSGKYRFSICEIS